MFLISSRRGFTSNKAFSNTDLVSIIGDVKTRVLTTEERFLSHILSEKILLIVHGFNNPFSYILPEYMQLREQYKNQLGNHYDYIVGYTWPAGESEIDYFQAKKNTDTAANRLNDWLCKLDDINCTVDIAGHSMAAMVGYKSLSQETSAQIRNIFSFGAAIPKKMLLKENIVNQALGKVEHVYAFYNRNDHILKYLFRLMEGSQALGCAGLPNSGYFENQKGKITAIDCTDINISHTGYMRSSEVTEFMEAVLRGQDTGRFTKLEKRDMDTSSSLRMDYEYALN